MLAGISLRLVVAAALLWCAAAASPYAQDEATSDNPLAALKDELARALDAASLPFSPEQERAIVLMMEERRQASESLFGDLMNFRTGPTSGQETDRLKSAIAWMRGEFATKIRAYLTADQLAVWAQLEAASPPPADGGARGGGGRQGTQTQFVRINNNSFTSESFFNGTGGSFAGGGFGGGFGGPPGGGFGGPPGGGFGGPPGGGRGDGGGGRGGPGGPGPVVIERGGAGAWHGNAQYLTKDESLNARNPFASNKPPYQERQFAADVGGPAIPGRLTSNVAVNYNRSENVGTVRATLASGEVYALGITRPFVGRSVRAENTYQISDANSVRGNVFLFVNRRENQGIGDYTLPERGSSFDGRNYLADLRQFSVLSSTNFFENRVQVSGNTNKTIPFSENVRINVPDAFMSGGAQNRGDERDRTVEFGTLYTRFGKALTIKAGGSGTHRLSRSTSTNNFGGTFNFDSLDRFRAGAPTNYRVNLGIPHLETTQLEFGGFFQNDIKLSEEFTLMAGVRYDGQANLDDHDNVAPRVAFAYGLGPATVIRGGVGKYYQRLGLNEVENQHRFDGLHQYELVIDNPSYPDPFVDGSLRQTFPSVRVWDADLRAPNSVLGMISLERTFWRTFLVTTSYSYEREHHRFRLRNLNAPVDTTSPVLRACQPGQGSDTCVKPNSSRGNVLNMESTGRETSQNLRVNGRYRFSIFNVSANYFFQDVKGDNPGNQLPADNFNLRADWAPNQNARHQGGGTINAQLPLGMFLSGTIAANSGRNYSITTGSDDNKDTNTNDRPPGVPRNSATGPKYLNFNFNVSKAIYLDGPSAGTRKNVNVFVNLTNAFNRVHYGTPSGVITSPDFGRSTSADSPREIELGLRFQF